MWKPSQMGKIEGFEKMLKSKASWGFNVVYPAIRLRKDPPLSGGFRFGIAQEEFWAETYFVRRVSNRKLMHHIGWLRSPLVHGHPGGSN